MPWKRGRSGVSTKQLLDVFSICDPSNSGRVRIEYLHEVVSYYAGDQAKAGFEYVIKEITNSPFVIIKTVPDYNRHHHSEILLRNRSIAITTDINAVFRRLDRNHFGSLTFRQFAAGFRLVMRQQKDIHEKSKQDITSPTDDIVMMSPITLKQSTLEPRFLISPPDTTQVNNNNGTTNSTSTPNGITPSTTPRRKQVYNRTLNGNSTVVSGSTISNDSTGCNGLTSRTTVSGPSGDKSQCSSLSDTENYECFADEGNELEESPVDADGGDSGISTGNDNRQTNDGITSPLSNPSINRNTWLRTSLRRSSPSHHDSLPHRKWGSFRQSGRGHQPQLSSNSVASHLYRSSSFNSSGRSSTCDTADDMYSDGSLEEDPVLDLNHKVQELQKQMGVFQDSANHNNERYAKIKADNSALQVRVIMLEEQLRETEMRYEERLQDEQKRSKELTSRIDRERQLQLENSGIRLHAAESEAGNAKDELNRQRVRIEKLEQERKQLTDHVQDLRNELLDYKQQEHTYKETERRLIKEQDMQVHLIDELSHDVEKLRAESRTPALPTTSPEALRLDELHEEMTLLREKNQQLLEVNEELQASILHAGVEQGRKLTAGVEEFSLKAELEAMSQDEPDKPMKEAESVAKMQQALKDLKDVNNDLRTYIDGILLNIVENYPHLLEVKLKRSA